MTFQEVAYSFTQELAATSTEGWVAFIFSVISVLLANKNYVWLYPTGIVGTILYTYIYADAGLYAESALNIYYLIMSVYGWLRWNKHHENQSAIAITHNTGKDWAISLAISIAGFFLLYFILDRCTDSTVPIWDAVVSSFAWAGMWLLAKHKIENWLFLNISNAIAIPLLIYKHLPLAALLTLILFIVAVFGYFSWRKMYRTQQA